MPSDPRILLVDDDFHLAASLADWLRDVGFDVDTARDFNEAKSCLAERSFELIITDLRLGDQDGFDLVRYASKHHTETAVLVMTGYATPDTAVEAVRAGAFDLLTKPVIDDELLLAIDRAINHHQIEKENESLRQQLDRRAGLENILSHDYRMLKIFDVIDSVADAKASILITGENGTGKSMIARAIHNRSARRGGPFVEVACGALPDNLLESELFGHVAGAYTGAHSDRKGKFELADGGTLFLDEIGTATPAMQVKLLRVLQEFQFEPLGGMETRKADTRVILATNDHLETAVSQGTFRQDLYYRINVVNIVLPSLRERPGDIPLLVDHFLREAAEAASREVESFTRDALNALQSYAWPGNVRQLENVVERAVLLSSGKNLGLEDLPPEVLGNAMATSANGVQHTGMGIGFGQTAPETEASHGPIVSCMAGQSLRDALEAPEREIILQSLRRHNWNRVATADELEINRTTLYKKMKRLGLDDPRLQYAM
ncbi:DNA-binding transcriptional response regulator, NtrC family, contains REC, AAA-type ATPase, and a Fis-type DNA-binding domains [Neorhodopirellula lusitana]|uniref:DNA-binding transcriptional response regulator, NtrC family, contains REC, AAA-type ATPase, and a Fis-type DNA-binding domains n=1 Tax=Neorhodopirellula lusitana TaxID=445327 RepID=A0ABY1PRZ3_9BACT|nr:sigma-54 dependent transcriptional regulator [Neorhodopirellula lusitana]SMP44276.1 DNA-binding transcriptional response regulator, NtrC family, contains REC, AAA-type ATPase, and a Fis-type DNA-binding domains [Neorhodopirellula lusitana]